MEQIIATLPNRAEEVSGSQAKIGTISVANPGLHIDVVSPSIVREPSALYYISKRAIDIVLAVLGIIALIPVFVIIAACIKLDDGEDILHFREIIGKNGRRFYALKFRTMRIDADEYLAKRPKVPAKHEAGTRSTCYSSWTFSA